MLTQLKKKRNIGHHICGIVYRHARGNDECTYCPRRRGVFEGRSFGAEGEKEGEIVFNTSMTGYQEIMTDPSYKGQIVTMTYPLIGNYGVNDEDVESEGAQSGRLYRPGVQQSYQQLQGTGDLHSYFTKHNIIAIEEIDTRALTKHLRVRGAMKAIISTKDHDLQA